MEELTIPQLKEKYKDIEDKVPSVWKTYNEAAIEMAQDLSFGHWDIQDGEIIRVISVLQSYGRVKISQHIDPQFAFAGLYPHVMKSFNIDPREEAIKLLQSNCKHEKGYLTNTDGPSRCLTCGKPWC